MITLLPVNNGDGTVTVTVTGSTVGFTNTLYYQRVNTESPESWGSAGSRVSDGDITAALADGMYYLYVESSNGGGSVISQPYQVTMSDTSTKDIFTRCMESAQDVIQSLSLTGLDNDKVYLRTIPRDSSGLTFPCVFVCPYGTEIHNPTGGTNLKDEIIYPVLIAYLDSGNQESGNASARQTYLLARERIAKAFRNQRMPGISESILVQTNYLDVVDRSAWFDKNLYAGGIVLNITTWQTRGI